MRLCSIDGCENKHEAKGYCRNHYKSFKKYGDPFQAERTLKKSVKKIRRVRKQKNLSTVGVCSIEDCNNPIKSRLLCDMHYARLRRNGTTETSGKHVIIDVETCLVIGCENKHYRRGFCTTHIKNMRQLGTPLTPKVVKICGVKDCKRVHLAKGMCQLHYNQWEVVLKKYGLDNVYRRD